MRMDYKNIIAYVEIKNTKTLKKGTKKSIVLNSKTTNQYSQDTLKQITSVIEEGQYESCGIYFEKDENVVDDEFGIPVESIRNTYMVELLEEIYLLSSRYKEYDISLKFTDWDLISNKMEISICLLSAPEELKIEVVSQSKDEAATYLSADQLAEGIRDCIYRAA